MFLIGMLPCQAKADSVLDDIVQSRRIINVHEHIQHEANVPELLEVMDKMGIQKTILVGSSWFTLRLYESVGFTKIDENNRAILDIVKKYPQRFEAWPTLDPNDTTHLDKIKDLIKEGATGVKLYVGHGYQKRRDGSYMFHPMAMDDPKLAPLFAWCQENFIPMNLHVNSDKPGFAQEFIAVMTQFPNLKINCPHWMLSTIKDSRLREYLDTFPNLYADISFGHDEFLIDGVKRISVRRTSFKRILEEYPTRFFFGTDFVYTDFVNRNVDWAAPRIQVYYDMLSRNTYTIPGVTGELNGLALPKPILESILYKNYEAFIAARPTDTTITEKVDWSRMRIRPMDRTPGQTYPPPPQYRRRR